MPKLVILVSNVGVRTVNGVPPHAVRQRLKTYDGKDIYCADGWGVIEVTASLRLDSVPHGSAGEMLRSLLDEQVILFTGGDNGTFMRLQAKVETMNRHCYMHRLYAVHQVTLVKRRIRQSGFGKEE